MSLSEVSSQTKKLILSTEGLHNHWFDLSARSKKYLYDLKQVLPVRAVCFLRSHEDYIISLYGQNLKNPWSPKNPSYGRDLSLEEMMNISWFRQHLDYQGFIEELFQVFSRGNVDILKYDGNTINMFLKYLGENEIVGDENKVNISMSASAMEILRIVNRTRVAPKKKKRIVDLVKRIDNNLTPDNISELMHHDSTILNYVIKHDKRRLNAAFEISFEQE